ncbi:hypothetical protein [Enterobacter cloacae]|uniref:hypothetical protein n=1 Tax=Enterobacter cloacae TaxID=550 RepID=UPI0024DF61E7|nr:hypothetical protein [Enterobacter cloacae]MDK2708847.1 hypothetical protein [Enterobacter cloacae]
MDIPMFFELWLFDTYIEPQGPVMNDLYQARLAHTVKAYSSVLSEKGRKEMKLEDFLMLKDTVFKSPEELERIKKQQAEQNKKAVEAMMGPALMAKAQNAAARLKAKQNG